MAGELRWLDKVFDSGAPPGRGRSALLQRCAYVRDSESLFLSGV